MRRPDNKGADQLCSGRFRGDSGVSHKSHFETELFGFHGETLLRKNK